MKQFRQAQERLAQSANHRWTKAEVIESLRTVLADHGRLKRALIDQAERTPSVTAIVKHFGSLRAAYAAIGYNALPKPSGDGKYWSNEDIQQGLRKLYKARGAVLGRLIDDFPNLPSSGYVKRRFGTIREATRQAGLPVLSESEVQHCAWERRRAAGCAEYYRGVRSTDARLLRGLRQIQKHYGFVSVNLLCRDVGVPSANYYARRFRSFGRAKALANLPEQTHSQIMLSALKRKKEMARRPGPRPKLWHRSDDILVGLKGLARREGVISARLIDEDADLPSWAAVVNHFGSLTKAYRLAGLVRLSGGGGRYGLPLR